MTITYYAIATLTLLSFFTELHARDLNVSFGSTQNSGADNPDGTWNSTQDGILYDTNHSAGADNIIIATDETKRLEQLSLGYGSKVPNLDIRFGGPSASVSSKANANVVAPPSSYGIAKVANSLSTAFSENMTFGSSSVTLSFSNLSAGKYSFSFLSGFLRDFQIVTDTPGSCNLGNVSMSYGTCETNRGGNQKEWFKSSSVSGTVANIEAHNKNWTLDAVAADINGVEITEDGGSFSIILNTETINPRSAAMMLMDDTATRADISGISLSAMGLSVETQSVPEPSSAFLALFGLSGWLMRRRRA